MSRTATAPLERVKIMYQLQTHKGGDVKYTSMTDCVRQMVRNDGVAGLWRGNGVNVVRIAPYAAIGFVTNERTKHFFTKPGQEQPHGWASTLAGGVAGLCASTATYPLDVVRTRLTVQTGAEHKYNGIWDALVRIRRTEGFFGLYKGIGATLLGIIPFNSINFGVYDWLRKTYAARQADRKQKMSPAVSLLLGGISGSAAATATYPLDLMRRRMQMRAELGEADVYRGFMDAATRIVRKEGVVGLFRGLVPCYLKVIPSNAVNFFVYEWCRQLLKF